jgi:HD-like signal output (HDOD) protein
MTQDLVSKVREDILTQLKNDELVLPTLPEIALSVREVAEDENATINDLSHVLLRDPAMSARLLRVANSPMVRTVVPITDITTAVSRLGIDFTTNLVIGIAMEQMFQATNELIDNRMRACWSRAIEVAASAQVLARHFTQLPADQALLAGLVHQIGMLPILAYAENSDTLLKDSLSLDHVIAELHQELGALVLKSWDLPEALIKVASEYLTFERQPDDVDFTDLVQVAVLQSYTDTDHPLGQIDSASVGAFARLGLEADEEDHQLSAIAEEVDATQYALTPR